MPEKIFTRGDEAILAVLDVCKLLADVAVARGVVTTEVLGIALDDMYRRAVAKSQLDSAVVFQLMGEFVRDPERTEIRELLRTSRGRRVHES